MKKAALFIMVLAIVFFLAGCGKKPPGGDPAGGGAPERAAEQERPLGGQEQVRETGQTGSPGPPTEKPASGETPSVVIKTPNQASSQEAGRMLDELDRQLTELLNTLERLEDIKEEDLQYEGVTGQ